MEGDIAKCLGRRHVEDRTSWKSNRKSGVSRRGTFTDDGRAGLDAHDGNLARKLPNKPLQRRNAIINNSIIEHKDEAKYGLCYKIFS